MPVFEIQAPDGRVYEVEGPTAEGAVEAVRSMATARPDRISGAFQDAAAQPETRLSKNLPGGYGMGDYIKGQLPFADELAGVVGGIGSAVQGQGFSKGYDEKRALERRYAEEYAADNPGLATTGTALGVALAGPSRAAIAPAATLPGRIAQGARSAAPLGAVYGAAEGDGLVERAQNAAGGALFSAGVGATIPAATAGITRALSKNPNAFASVDDMRVAKNAAYQAVDNSGAAYTPKAYDFMLKTVAADLKRAKLNPLRHPKAASIMEDLAAEGGKPLTLTELDQLRQVVRRDVVDAGDEAEQFFGEKIIDGIDYFIDTAKPAQMASGDPVAAAAAIRNARLLNTRMRKAEMIDDAIIRAARRAASTGSGGNVENTIRQNIRSILDSPSKSRSFTKEERAIMEKIVDPKDANQDLARLVGKLSPNGNGLMAALGLGAVASNPVFAIAPAVGMVAKSASEGATMRRVDALQRAVRGAPASSIPVPAGAFNAGRLLTNEAVPYLDQVGADVLPRSMPIWPPRR